MRNHSGFSLIELVIANGAFAVIILIAVSLWMLTGNRHMEGMTSLESNELVDEVRLNLFSPEQCTANFAGVALDMSNPQGVEVTQVKRLTGPTATEVFLTKGASARGLVVDNMRIFPVEQISILHLQANFEIKMSRTGSGKISLAPKNIGVLAQVQGGKIQKCWLKQKSDRLTANQMCRTISGGALNEYDERTGTCILTNGQWFTGNAHTATCPAGTVLSEQANRDYNCRLVPPAGFVDTFPTFSVQMTNGATATQSRMPFNGELDKNAKTCRCYYATDLSPAILSTFRCGIQCVVL